MTTTLAGAEARDAMHARIDRLSRESVRKWGTMSAHEMVCHAADQLRIAMGDIDTQPGPLRFRFGSRELKAPLGPLRFEFYRRVAVGWLPWPRARLGAAPEMLTTAPAEWHGDIAALQSLVDRVGRKDLAETWAPHPLFGRISGREWSFLCWKHLDYHLRQFGV